MNGSMEDNPLVKLCDEITVVIKEKNEEVKELLKLQPKAYPESYRVRFDSHAGTDVRIGSRLQIHSNNHGHGFDMGDIVVVLEFTEHNLYNNAYMDFTYAVVRAGQVRNETNCWTIAGDEFNMYDY